MTDPALRYINNPGHKAPVTDMRAACSTDNAIVTETILAVLADGGNAADAAIAGSMVQAAVQPFMTNHTGTVTFLYYHAATGSFHQLDSTGTLPAGVPLCRPVPQIATTWQGKNPPACCIPGFMPGMKAIHERFGTMGWARLTRDAIRWAEEGHPVSTFEYGVTSSGQDFLTYFPEGRDLFMPGGFYVPVGERFANRPLAETLRRVAEEGPDHMISGDWAKAFVAKGRELGWQITLDHMTAATLPRWIEPMRFAYRDHEIVSLAAPQQQGVYLAMVMGILDHLGIAEVAPGSAEHLFYMAHAMRYALWHCGYLGDPTISPYALDQLADPAFHAAAARMIKGLIPARDLSDHVRLTSRPGVAGPGIYTISSAPGRPSSAQPVKEPTGSCELAIVDAEGNWVQMMNTMQSGGIPAMVIGGVPMIGTHVSFAGISGIIDVKLAENARQRSVMGNTMIVKDGRPVLSLGSPGNVRFTVPQVISYLLDFGYAPYEAADAPRMNPFGEDGSITIEDRVSAETVRQLARWGVDTRALPAYDYHMGSYQMCFRDPATGTIGATADPRRCGVADGLR